jgi:hypothetical protein
MAWWSTPQPQEDEQSTTSMPLLPVDPDHGVAAEEDGPFTHYPQWERDEDGWPIIPPQQDDTRPSIWK